MCVKPGITEQEKVRHGGSTIGSARLVLDNHLDNQSGKTD